MKSVKPGYPARLSTGKIEGWVEVEFTVAENGKVRSVVRVNASPRGVFDGAAVKPWRNGVTSRSCEIRRRQPSAGAHPDPIRLGE